MTDELPTDASADAAPPGERDVDGRQGGARVRSPWSPLRRWIGGLAAVATLAVAVLGAWTGTTAWRDARHVVITLDPEPHAKDRDRLVEDFQIAIVNSSARPVTLNEGVVVVNDVELGRVTQMTFESESGPRSLPVTLGPGESAATSLTWELPLEHVLSEVEDEALTALGQGMPFVIRLRFAPGGTREVEVGTQNEDPLQAPQGALDLTYRSPWGEPQALVQADRVTALRLTPFSSGAQLPPDVATVRLWSRRKPRPDTVVSRPVLAWLPLPRLSPGSYVFAISVSGRVVATGAFKTPCRLRADYFESGEIPQPPAIHVDYCMSGEAPPAGEP